MMFWASMYCLALVLVALAAYSDIKQDRAYEREIERHIDASRAAQEELMRRIRNVDHMTTHRADERTNPGDKNYVRD